MGKLYLNKCNEGEEVYGGRPNLEVREGFSGVGTYELSSQRWVGVNLPRRGGGNILDRGSSICKGPMVKGYMVRRDGDEGIGGPCCKRRLE